MSEYMPIVLVALGLIYTALLWLCVIISNGLENIEDALRKQNKEPGQ